MRKRIFFPRDFSRDTNQTRVLRFVNEGRDPPFAVSGRGGTRQNFEGLFESPSPLSPRRNCCYRERLENSGKSSSSINPSIFYYFLYIVWIITFIKRSRVPHIPRPDLLRLYGRNMRVQSNWLFERSGGGIEIVSTRGERAINDERETHTRTHTRARTAREGRDRRRGFEACYN